MTPTKIATKNITAIDTKIANPIREPVEAWNTELFDPNQLDQLFLLPLYF